SWGSTKLPVVLQPEGGTPTEAALLVEELQRWLNGNRLRSCGQGEAVGLPRGVWQCRLSTAASKDARIVWTVSGSATIPLDSAADAVSSLDGTTRPVSGGAALTVSTRPVLVRSR